jgi:hypothetical protein
MSNTRMNDASLTIERIAREIVALNRYSDETGNDTRAHIWSLIVSLDVAVEQLDSAQGERLIYVPSDEDEDKFEMEPYGEEVEDEN